MKFNVSSYIPTKEETMRGKKYFKPPIPNGFQIYDEGQVQGLKYREMAVNNFFKGSNQTLTLERDSNNAHDPNAIKVIGVSDKFREFIGYIPKEISKKIIDRGLLQDIKVRLIRIYEADNGYKEISFQILRPKNKKEKYR